MKKLLILLISIAFFSCNEENKPSYVVFDGTVENSPSKVAKIFGNGFETELSISEDGSFGDTLNIKSEGYYTLRIGRESTPIYLVNGSDLTISLDSNGFDESIAYTGTNAAENNYLAAKYLLSEEIEKPFTQLFKLTENDFIKEVSSYNDAYINLMNYLDPRVRGIKRKITLF